MNIITNVGDELIVQFYQKNDEITGVVMNLPEECKGELVLYALTLKDGEIIKHYVSNIDGLGKKIDYTNAGFPEGWIKLDLLIDELRRL